MYKDRHLEGAFQVLVSKNLKTFQNDDDTLSFVLGLQRQFSLTDSEMVDVIIKSVFALIKRCQEETNEEINRKDESELYKVALKVGVETHLLPLKIKAELSKIRHTRKLL